jgi:hypothetical protein
LQCEFAPNGETVHDAVMPNDDILAERAFTISHKGVSYPIKARALFMSHGFQPEEVGVYHLTFMSRGESIHVWQPDKNLYSREQARKAAESSLSSGSVEAFARREIEGWINVGDVY